MESKISDQSGVPDSPLLFFNSRTKETHPRQISNDFLLVRAGPNKNFLKTFQEIRGNEKNMHVQSAGSGTAPAATSRGIGKRTAPWPTRKPAAVRTVRKCMCPCQPSRCTCEHTIRAADVPFVANAFLDHGSCRDTSELILVSISKIFFSICHSTNIIPKRPTVFAIKFKFCLLEHLR